jgi:hypothetical protein
MPDNLAGALTASVGALRWVATIYRRDQSPADDMALTENLVPLATVHANIQPSYPSTFFQSTQIDGPVTHMIDLRWQYFPATIEVVICSTRVPSGGLRSDIYRVRRSTEIGGRKRFIRLECEFERSRFTRDDSDATRNDVLTEPFGYAATLWDEGATSWDAASPNGTPWDVGERQPEQRTPWDQRLTAWDDAGTTTWDVPP